MAITYPGQSPQEMYDTLVGRLGKAGLNITKELDVLSPDELSRMQNVVRILDGALESRPGQTSLATAGTNHHSIGRLNNPQSSNFTRFVGADTAVYQGTAGALTSRDTSYSGDPLTLLPHRPTLSGQPWMFVADRSRMRKISTAGVVSTIGLAAPSNAATAALVTASFTNVCKFDNTDTPASNAAAWTLAAGKDMNGVATGVPTAADDTAIPGSYEAGGSVIFTSVPGAATKGYYQTASLSFGASVRDLTSVNAVAATDDDLIRLSIGVNDTSLLDEIRVYLVCSATFTPSIIPGTSTTGLNDDAWWKSFTGADLTNLSLSAVDAQDDLRDAVLRQTFGTDNTVADSRTSIVNTLGATEISRFTSKVMPSWPNSLGTVGYPLRRGEFARIGNTTGRGWNNITGIIIVLRATGATGQLLCQIDGMALTGGGGADSADIGDSQYDWRYTHYDPAVGAESNPSPVMTSGNWLDVARQQVTVTPTASGTATYRQRIYRRGGTLPTDWYFVAANASDGGAYTDFSTDAAITASAVLQTDNDQAITTVDSNGTTVLAQPLPCLWGPVSQLLFACGDPYRPGFVYWCKPGIPDSWPAVNCSEVCSPSEELMNGGVYAGAAFVFSRERLFQLHPNVVNGTGVVAMPTACSEGLTSRWGLAVGRNGIFFVARDGIRVTAGGESVLISRSIASLFEGVTRNGYLPIDFTVPAAIRLAIHDSDLWFVYRDTGGVNQCMVYNLIDQAWRYYSFANQVSGIFSEPNNAGGMQLLLGGRTTGATYTHTGTSDAGTGIACIARTGAWDFGRPREDKRLGDVIINAAFGGALTLTLTTYLNNETTTNTAQTVTTSSAEKRYMFDPFGTDPQSARNVSFDLSWTAPAAVSAIHYLGCAARTDPDTVMRRATAWEELPGGEGYLTGVRITTDTGNVGINIDAEYTTDVGSVTAASSVIATANGRRILHFTWGAVYAQQVRLRPTGSCLSWKLYKVEWLTQNEPPRIAGWNTNWDAYGILSDKWLKGFLIHCDTFNVAKSWSIDADGTNGVQTGTITQNGPGVQFVAFAKSRGRLFRFRATDANLGKLYKFQPVFDVEPLSLTRWETEEVDHGYQGWQIPIDGYFTLRSSASVTLTMTSFDQLGATVNARTYTISSTAGVKAARYVQFNPDKGVQFTYVLTSANPFWLYREESVVNVQPFDGKPKIKAKPFGNDNNDPSRGMTDSSGAAARSGGTLNPGAG